MKTGDVIFKCGCCDHGRVILTADSNGRCENCKEEYILKALPWKRGYANGTNGNIITDANDNGVCTVYDIPQNSSVEETKNREGTVRATLVINSVNHHDEMLNALKQCLSDFKWLESLDDKHNFRSSILLAENIINKVEEV